LHQKSNSLSWSMQVGWPRRPVAKMEAALKHSYMVSTLTLRNKAAGPDEEELLIGAHSTEVM